MQVSAAATEANSEDEIPLNLLGTLSRKIKKKKKKKRKHKQQASRGAPAAPTPTRDSAAQEAVAATKKDEVTGEKVQGTDEEPPVHVERSGRVVPTCSRVGPEYQCVLLPWQPGSPPAKRRKLVASAKEDGGDLSFSKSREPGAATEEEPRACGECVWSPKSGLSVGEVDQFLRGYHRRPLSRTVFVGHRDESPSPALRERCGSKRLA